MSEVTKKIPCILRTDHYRVYKCTAILHVPMGRAHRESSMSKLDYDATRVANIYIYIYIYIWNYPIDEFPLQTKTTSFKFHCLI